ncbi:ladderlectin-like isoform X2 [Girardinichthys multiradiatus]|nr:ladderlectin-like isoform X2 [Girardinichthys multiradiatus]
MKLLAVCVLVFSVMAQTRADPVPDDDSADEEQVDLLQRSDLCPPGWTQLNSRCFKYVPRPLSWAAAERNCLSMGANLASVQDMNEYHQIQNIIQMASSMSKEAWIGGSNAQELNIWLWTDGSRFSYTHWCPGEPNSSNQRCLQMNYSAEKCWDDQICAIELPSVCAKKVQSV